VEEVQKLDQSNDPDKKTKITAILEKNKEKIRQAQ